MRPVRVEGKIRKTVRRSSSEIVPAGKVVQVQKGKVY